MTPSDQHRILVVGGGMIGVNVAFAAANAGHRVTLIDRRERGRVGDRLNLGAIRLCGQDATALPLALAARRHWDTIAAYVPGIGLKTTGSIALLRDQHDIQVAEAYLAETDDALGLSMLVGGEITSLEPTISGGYPAAIRCRDDARLEPGRAVGALIEHLWLHDGVDTRFATDVTGIYSSGAAVTVVTSSGTIEADHVFICSNSVTLDHPNAATAGLTRIPLQTIVGRAAKPLETIVTDITSFPRHRAATLDTNGSSHHWPWLAVPTERGSLVVGVAGTPADTEGDEDPAAANRLGWLQTVLEYTFGIPANGGASPHVLTKSLIAHPSAPYAKIELQPHVVAIAGLGLQATTMAPAVAHEVLARLA